MTGNAVFIPTLRYRDPGAAISWLRDVVGLSATFVAEEHGKIVHAQLRLGDGMVFIGPDYPDDKYGMHSPLALNGTNQCVYIAINEVIDDHCVNARARGAHILTEPYDTPYGSREYSLRDLEGHVWCVGTYRGLPVPADLLDGKEL